MTAEHDRQIDRHVFDHYARERRVPPAHWLEGLVDRLVADIGEVLDEGRAGPD